MHDANDIESVDEDFYSDGDGYGYGDSAMDSDAGKNYTVLKEEDIRQRQEDDITRISTVLSISREAACILLRRYN
nr:probable E3 ubiquitin-protein ligase ARI7 [Ipomoea batatas]GME00578.1 probable E3 ubiquitin-protein ligase ARI7 [Ipomoea batatas]